MGLYVSSTGKILCSNTGGFLTPADPSPIGELNPDNFMLVSDPIGTAEDNYPFKRARPFAEGEIVDYPQAVINGVPVLTQSHVEQRWPDGTVKHAVMFFHLPTLTSSPDTIAFQNQLDGNETGGLTAADVLADWDFEATMALTSGATTHTASARTMLAAGHYEVHFSGPIATEFIIRDHSEFPAYDFGFTAPYTPFRPIFHATFWPLTNRTCVRYIGENSKPQEVTNIPVDNIVLKLGQASPVTKYTSGVKTILRSSRWTKRYWNGTAPTAINCNHNKDYLASTMMIPKWNPDVTIPESIIVSNYASWLTKGRDLYNNGAWNPNMGDPGGRADIGIATGWTVQWLYTGDYRHEEVVMGQADLAASWQFHNRETIYHRPRPFQRLGTADGGGRVVSPNVRPSLFMQTGSSTSATANAADRFLIVGPTTVSPWITQLAHQPEPYLIPYLLTGDFWLLEQAWFWSAFNACYGNPSDANYACRGPANSGSGGLEYSSEARTTAWPLRSRVQCAAFTPERFSEEKQLFTTLTEDFIEIAEGYRVPTSPRAGGTLYNWGEARRSSKWPSGIGIDPNGSSWCGGNTTGTLGVHDPSVYQTHSQWMSHYIISALGVARDLGFDVQYLMAYMARDLTSRVMVPDRVTSEGTLQGLHYLGTYRTPYLASPAPGTHYANMTQITSMYLADPNPPDPNNKPLVQWNTQKLDITGGRPNWALSAAAMVFDEPNGPATWAWFEANLLDAEGLARYSANPMNCLVPRNRP